MTSPSTQDLSKLSHRFQVRFAIFCANQVKHLWAQDKRCVSAVETAERWLVGEATQEECREAAYVAASAATYAAAHAATYAATAAYAAAYAAAAYASASDKAAAAAYASDKETLSPETVRVVVAFVEEAFSKSIFLTISLIDTEISFLGLLSEIYFEIPE